jgi:hypothetical protein
MTRFLLELPSTGPARRAWRPARPRALPGDPSLPELTMSSGHRPTPCLLAASSTSPTATYLLATAFHIGSSPGAKPSCRHTVQYADPGRRWLPMSPARSRKTRQPRQECADGAGPRRGTARSSSTTGQLCSADHGALKRGRRPPALSAHELVQAITRAQVRQSLIRPQIRAVEPSTSPERERGGGR